MRTSSEHLEPLVECSSLLEAEVVRGLLESRGLHAQVLSRESAWRNTVLGVQGATEIRVAVPAEEAAQARLVLEEVHDTEYAVEETRAPHCPECGSEEVERETTSTWFVAGLAAALFLTLYLVLRVLSLFNVLLFVAVLVLAAAVLLGGDGWRCTACRHRWTEAA